jgi:hypothetical protein
MEVYSIFHHKKGESMSEGSYVWRSFGLSGSQFCATVLSLKVARSNLELSLPLTKAQLHESGVCQAFIKVQSPFLSEDLTYQSPWFSCYHQEMESAEKLTLHHCQNGEMHGRSSSFKVEMLAKYQLYLILFSVTLCCKNNFHPVFHLKIQE